MKLGIIPERIAPGHPEQNGRHERMHRTLKAETAHPPAAHRRAQQEAFDRFRPIYNEQRPHEALAMKTPASCYTLSPRCYPTRFCNRSTTVACRYVGYEPVGSSNGMDTISSSAKHYATNPLDWS